MAADFQATIELDTTGILRQILDIGRKLDEVLARGKQVTITADTTAATAKLDALGNKVIKPKIEPDLSTFGSRFDKALSAAETKVLSLKSELAGAVFEGAGDKDVEKIKVSLAAAEKEARQLRVALNGVDKEIDQVNNTKIDVQPPSGFNSIGSGLLAGLAGGGALGAIQLATQKIGEAFSFVVDEGSRFETALLSVSAVTGVTGAGLDDIGERAQGLAEKFGGSSTEQLGVFQTALSKIGPQLANSSTDLTTFADNVNTLSKTDAALGAAGAVDALSGSLLQFGVNVNDTAEVAAKSTQFMNVLAASAGVGSASVAQVAEAIGVVGSSAANANVTFEETNAALQVLASKALVGSSAGTALTAVINKLQAAPGPAGEKLKELGTSSQKLGELLTKKGIGAAMDELRGAMSQLGSDAEKNAFLVQMFGETGLNAASALLSGGDKLAEFTKGVTGTQAAVDQAAINMNTFSERMSRLKAVSINVAQDVFAGVSSVVATIGNVIGEVVDNLKPLFDEIFENFKEMYETLKPIYALLGGAVVGVAIVLFGQLTLAVRVVTDVISTMYSRISEALMPIFDKLGAVFKSSGGEAVTLSGVLKAFADVLSFVGDTAGAIGGLLIEFLITPIEQIIGVVTTMMDVFGGATDEMQQAGQTAQKTGGFFEKLGQFLKDIPNYVDGATAAFRELKEIIGDAFNILKDIRFDNITEQFSKLFDLFGVADDRLAKGFDDGFNQNALKTAQKAAEDKKQAEIDAKKQELTAKEALQKGANKEEKKALDDLSKEIQTAERALAKLKSDQNIKSIDDEKERELAAAEEIKAKRIQAIQDEIEAAKKRDNVSGVDKQKLLGILNENLQLQVASNIETDAVNAKYNEAAFTRERKAQDDLAKLKIDSQQRTIEHLTSNEFATLLNAEEIARRRVELQRLNGEAEVKAFIEGTELFKAAEATITAQVKLGNISTAEAVQQLARVRKDVAATFQTGADPLSLSYSALNQKIAADERKIHTDNLEFLNNARIGTIEEQAEREREAAIAAAQKTYNQELRLAGDNENLKFLAFKKFKSAQVAAEQKYLQDTKSMYTTAALSLLDNLSNALKKAFTPNKQAQEDAKKGVEDIANAEKELYKQRASNSISFEDFQTKIAELAKQEAEFKEKLAGMGFSLGDAFKTAFGEALGGLSETMQQEAVKASAKYSDIGAVINSTNREIDRLREEFGTADVTRQAAITTEIAKLEKDRGKAAEESSDVASAAYTAMGISVGATLVQMTLSGKANIGEMVIAVLNGLQALVPVFAAQIYGAMVSSPNPVNIASLGGAGLLAATGLTLGLTALVEIAKAAVRSGYKTGGYTGDIPEDAPAGVVHGKEFVHTAEVTRTNRNLFQFLHKGGTLPEYVRKAGLDMPQMQTVDVLEMTKRFEKQVVEFQAKRKEIDNRVAEITRTMPIIGRGGNDELLRELRETNRRLAQIEAAQFETAKDYRAHTAVEMHVTSDTAVLDVEMKRAAIRNIMRGG